MICNIPEQRKQFEEYMFDCFGKNIISQTTEVFNRIEGKVVKPEYLKNYIDVLEKYEIPYKIRKKNEHIFYGDLSKLDSKARTTFNLFYKDDRLSAYIQDEEVGICYLEQYEVTDKKREKIFKKTLEDFFWEKRDAEVRSSSVLVGNTNEFLFDEARFSDRYCYFVMDEQHKEDAINIARYVLGYEVEINHLDVINPEFDINGLIWFKFKNEKSSQTSSSLSYKLLCLLLDSLINHCIFTDRDGKINFDIRMRFRDDDDRKSVWKFRTDLHKVFKSSWESNFARILNYLNIEWEYEKESFELEDRYYFPDFFLPNNVIVEIKGFWDVDSKKKVQDFIEKYRDYKLYLIDSDMFISLENLYKEHISEWEGPTVTISKEILPVVGITLPQRKKFVASLQIGDEVLLKRDPGNPYDKHAIQVLNKNGDQIGFISKDWAPIYASKLDIGMIFKATIKSKAAKVIKVEVERDNISENIIYDFLMEPAAKNK